MSKQKAPHNRTLSGGTQEIDSSIAESKEDAFRTSPKPSNEGLRASSIAPAEDAELREKNTTLDQVVRFIVKTIRDDDKLNPGQPELILQDVAGILRSAPYFTQQASRIRAEVLEEVEQITQRDFVHDGSSAAFDEGRKYEQFLNKQALASLRQKPGERGQQS